MCYTQANDGIASAEEEEEEEWDSVVVVVEFIIFISIAVCI